MTSIQNAVINSVLCYLSSARHLLEEQSLIASCITFYNRDIIYKAKEVMCNFASEDIIKRRGDDKIKSDIVDILTILKKHDEDEKPLPKFLCDGYNKMPPSNEFEIITEHLVGLVSEVSSLKEEIKILKNKPQTIKQPPPQQPANNRTSNGNVGKSSGELPNKTLNQNPGTSWGSSRSSSTQRQKETNGEETNQRSLNPNATAFMSNHENRMSHNNIIRKVETQNERAPSDYEDGHGKWQDVKKRGRRPKVSIRGSKQPLGQFKGVQDTKDLYIGRCHGETQVSHIEEHVKNEFGIDSISCEVISHESSRVKAFRMTVLSTDIEQLLRADLWPTDVRVRKYYSGYSRKTNPNQ